MFSWHLALACLITAQVQPAQPQIHVNVLRMTEQTYNELCQKLELPQQTKPGKVADLNGRQLEQILQQAQGDGFASALTTIANGKIAKVQKLPFLTGLETARENNLDYIVPIQKEKEFGLVGTVKRVGGKNGRWKINCRFTGMNPYVPMMASQISMTTNNRKTGKREQVPFQIFLQNPVVFEAQLNTTIPNHPGNHALFFGGVQELDHRETMPVVGWLPLLNELPFAHGFDSHREVVLFIVSFSQTEEQTRLWNQIRSMERQNANQILYTANSTK